MRNLKFETSYGLLVVFICHHPYGNQAVYHINGNCDCVCVCVYACVCVISVYVSYRSMACVHVHIYVHLSIQICGMTGCIPFLLAIPLTLSQPLSSPHGKKHNTEVIPFVLIS